MELKKWFVESQNDPANDPVLLWLNGGPGCSSLNGLLTSLGPFRIEEDAETITLNPYSWNKVANVLFLETPAGVGYSYTSHGNYTTDDDLVSQDNYLALQHFFRKFPNFAKNEFYVTGESYAGIYIPTLSVRILQGTAKINLKGFAIGNGLLDQAFLGNSVIFFAYYHGLIGEEVREHLTKICCKDDNFSPKTCHFTDSETSPLCAKTIGNMKIIVQNSSLNVYNIYKKCEKLPLDIYSRALTDMNLLLKTLNEPPNSKVFGETTPCTDASNLTSWLNQPKVREAIHIPDSLGKWTSCSVAVEAGYNSRYKTVKREIQELLRSRKVRGLVYNGDVDLVCNFLGDRWFVDDLKLKVQSGYSEWKYEDQIAGFYKQYENLIFATVKGAGHMVPEDKPGPSLKLISSFLRNEPL